MRGILLNGFGLREQAAQLVLRQKLFRVQQRPSKVLQSFRESGLGGDMGRGRLDLDVRRRTAEGGAIELVDHLVERSAFVEQSMEAVLFVDQLLLERWSVEELNYLGQ